MHPVLKLSPIHAHPVTIGQVFSTASNGLTERALQLGCQKVLRSYICYIYIYTYVYVYIYMNIWDAGKEVETRLPMRMDAV